ncbi:uncharacterized protein LOC117807058 [Notolabrus celidotus]|uniref:uncharacterized protein LOC117807058 n=1 Tax=Notolabrus celidotus TaxID=1203425 RepID=UPI0014901342|nr:uncharacterized protein LOC117807058 [Notolabrus celidotus]
MTPLLFALCVTCLLSGTMAGATSLDLSSPLRFLSVSVGEDVTLECFYQESVAVMFYWYKQTLGQKPEMVSKFYKHDQQGFLDDDFKNDPRFELETSTSTNHLKIRDVQDSDSGTYYCISGYAYVFDFIGGVIIHVRGSGLNVPALIHQSGSETIQPGGSVTLSCTVHTGSCDGEHSVYWFKDSEESQPGLIYTQGGNDDQCERERNQQTCVYNLLMKSMNLSHAGTYYCAVVSCGHVLFGNGTKLDLEDDEDRVVLVFVLSAALTVTTMLVVFLAYKALTMYKTTSCTCTDHQAGSPAASGLSAAGEQDADGLHYAALRKNKANRSTRPRDDTGSECVYSSVRQ